MCTCFNRSTAMFCRGGTQDNSVLTSQLLATMTAAARNPNASSAADSGQSASGGPLSVAERRYVRKHLGLPLLCMSCNSRVNQPHSARSLLSRSGMYGSIVSSLCSSYAAMLFIFCLAQIRTYLPRPPLEVWLYLLLHLILAWPLVICLCMLLRLLYWAVFCTSSSCLSFTCWQAVVANVRPDFVHTVRPYSHFNCRRRDLARRMETQTHAAWLLQKIGESSAASGAHPSFAASAQAIAASASQLSASYASGHGAQYASGHGSQLLPPLSPAAMFRGVNGQLGGSVQQQQQQQQLPPQQQQRQDALSQNELSITRTWDVVTRVRSAQHV